MKTYILTDTDKEMHWVINVADPAEPKITRGEEIQMRVQVVGYSKTMDAARKKELDERLRQK